MKKISCSTMGGSCDAEITGATAEEMMENGKKHVHGAAEAGDEGHKAIIKKMEELGEEGHKKWAEDFTTKFDGLEEA